MSATLSHRADEAGFSLLEMLVALTLFALVSVLLFGGVQLGARVLETGGRRTDQASRLSVASEFLRTQLAQAQPLERSVGERVNGKRPIEFDGVRDAVSFISPTSAFQPVGGLQVLGIHTERRGSTAQLVADWRPYRAADDAAAEPRQTVLFDDIAEVQLAYFGATAPKEQPRWRYEWRDHTALPSLIHIRVALRDGRTAPDLFIAPKLAEAR